MKEIIKKRVLNEAEYILTTNDTIRNTAKKFNVSKSTVHSDISKRLKEIDNTLTQEINNILDDHNNTKHIRGGISTKLKYKKG